MRRMLLWLLLFLSIGPTALFAQGDDCTTFTDQITVTTAPPGIEIEQIPVTLHRFHEISGLCTNWWAWDSFPEDVRTVPASCSAGNRRQNAQGSLICSLTSGPGGSPGCMISARLRCGGVDHIADMSCPANGDGTMPQATFDYEGPTIGIKCNYRPGGPNTMVSKRIECANSGTDLVVINCYENYLYCNTFIQH